MGGPYSAPEGAFLPEERKIQGERPPLQDEPAPVVIPVKKQGSPAGGSRIWITLLVAALASAVVAAVVSVGTTILMATFFKGGADRMIQKGERDNRLIQKGRVTLGPQQEREVFYAVPYAGPPNLVLVGADGFDVNWNTIKQKEQRADHFTVQCTATQGPSFQLEWVAEGLRR